MNRDQQMKKDIENKKYQAQEEYAKNKPLLAESVVQEKNDYIRPAEQRKTHKKSNDVNISSEKEKDQK